MDKTHCDNCDEVIPATAKRLTLLTGIGKGNNFENEETPRDYCLDCAQGEGESILEHILEDWSEELKAK